MRYLNYRDIKTLLDNPSRYWKEGPFKESDTYRLLNILLFNPGDIGDYFILDVKQPNKPGVAYIEQKTTLLNRHLRMNDSISLEDLKYLEIEARSAEPLLDSTFVADEELLKYEQFLLAKPGKKVVQPENVEEIKQYVKRLSKYTRIGEPCEEHAINSNIPNKVNGSILEYYDMELIGNVSKVGVTVRLPHIQTAIKRDEGLLTIITNIILTDEVLKFPESYKQDRLDILASLQRSLVLSIFGGQVAVRFMVIDEDKDFLFHVGNFISLDDILNKAHYAYKNKSTLPYDYLHSLVHLL